MVKIIHRSNDDIALGYYYAIPEYYGIPNPRSGANHGYTTLRELSYALEKIKTDAINKIGKDAVNDIDSEIEGGKFKYQLILS